MLLNYVYCSSVLCLNFHKNPKMTANMDPIPKIMDTAIQTDPEPVSEFVSFLTGKRNLRSPVSSDLVWKYLSRTEIDLWTDLASTY